MPKLDKPMRRKEQEAAVKATKPRLCKVCGKTYKLGDRVRKITLCGECFQDYKNASRNHNNMVQRLKVKGVDGVKKSNVMAKLAEFEVVAEAKATDLLSAYVSSMRPYGQESNTTLMTLQPPELNIEEHDIHNEFTPHIKRLFLNLYVKMPRQATLILEHLGISYQRYKKDLKEYPEFEDAVAKCEKKHLELLEIVSFHNALNPKATSERLFWLKASDPARYRDNYKGDTFNLGQVNIQVNSNIRGLGIPSNTVAGDGK